MADWHSTGPFDIPDVPDFIPRRLKPYLFILFVLIIQFSGGVYLAAATDMVGTTALMQEDILMAGYATLIGMSINFAVMFRIKFRYSNRIQLLVSGMVLIAANVICAMTRAFPSSWRPVWWPDGSGCRLHSRAILPFSSGSLRSAIWLFSSAMYILWSMAPSS